METFGLYLRQLREQAHLERPDVRFELRRRWSVKLSEDALGLWEAGKIAGIPAVPLACLARLYGVSFEQLFGTLFTARFGDSDVPAPTTMPPNVEESKPPVARRRRAPGKQS